MKQKPIEFVFCIYCPVRTGRTGAVNLEGHLFATRTRLFVQSHPHDIVRELRERRNTLLFTMANFASLYAMCCVHVSIIILYFIFWIIVVEFQLNLSSNLCRFLFIYSSICIWSVFKCFCVHFWFNSPNGSTWFGVSFLKW